MIFIIYIMVIYNNPNQVQSSIVLRIVKNP